MRLKSIPVFNLFFLLVLFSLCLISDKGAFSSSPEKVYCSNFSGCGKKVFDGKSFKCQGSTCSCDSKKCSDGSEPVSCGCAVDFSGDKPSAFGCTCECTCPTPTPQCGDLSKTACTGGACPEANQSCITVYYSNGTPMQCSCCPGGSAYCPTPTPEPTATPVITPTPVVTPTPTPWCGITHVFPGCAGGPCSPGLECREYWGAGSEMSGCGCLPPTPSNSDMPGDGAGGEPTEPTGKAKLPSFLRRLDSNFHLEDLTYI